ncbi:uncharacterized protein N7525_005316, partial [Penicillium rubens]|uniref:uncharacterized protein n=1 Tax=Penicillium rubens TaxID=1108849 RepID=UPI002A5AD604
GRVTWVILTLVLHPFIAHSPLSPPVDDTHPFFTSSINHALTFLTLNSSLVVNDLYDIDLFYTEYGTYDHRVWKTGLPVRSAVLKPHAAFQLRYLSLPLLISYYEAMAKYLQFYEPLY